MAFTETFNDQIYTPEGTLQASRSQSAQQLVMMQMAFASTATAAVTFAIANLKSVFILWTGSVTSLGSHIGALQVNGSGAETIDFNAGQPYEWQNGDYFTNKLGTNVTSLAFIPANGETHAINVRLLINSPAP